MVKIQSMVSLKHKGTAHGTDRSATLQSDFRLCSSVFQYAVILKVGNKRPDQIALIYDFRVCRKTTFLMAFASMAILSGDGDGSEGGWGGGE